MNMRTSGGGSSTGYTAAVSFLWLAFLATSACSEDAAMPQPWYRVLSYDPASSDPPQSGHDVTIAQTLLNRSPAVVVRAVAADNASMKKSAARTTAARTTAATIISTATATTPTTTTPLVVDGVFGAATAAAVAAFQATLSFLPPSSSFAASSAAASASSDPDGVFGSATAAALLDCCLDDGYADDGRPATAFGPTKRYKILVPLPSSNRSVEAPNATLLDRFNNVVRTFRVRAHGVRDDGSSADWPDFGPYPGDVGLNELSSNGNTPTGLGKLFLRQEKWGKKTLLANGMKKMVISAHADWLCYHHQCM